MFVPVLPDLFKCLASCDGHLLGVIFARMILAMFSVALFPLLSGFVSIYGKATDDIVNGKTED